MIFLARADIFLGARGLLPVRPVLAFLILAIPLIAVVLARESLRTDAFSRLLHLMNANRWPLFCLLLLSAASLISSFYAKANWWQGGQVIFLPTFSLVVFLVGLILSMVGFFRESPRRFFLLAWLVASISIILDLINPGTFSTVMFRAGGLAENANIASFTLIVTAAVMLDFDRPSLKDGLIICGTSAGVLATLSRAGIVLFLILCSIYALHIILRKRSAGGNPLATMVKIMIALSATLLLINWTIQTSDMFQLENAQRRLKVISGQESLWSSDESRIGLAREYVEVIADSPILGYGALYSMTRPKGSHNMYLDLWANDGLIGMFAYLSFLASAFWLLRSTGYAGYSVVVMLTTIYGMFSHNLLYSKSLFLLLGIICGFSVARTFSGDASPGYLGNHIPESRQGLSVTSRWRF